MSSEPRIRVVSRLGLAAGLFQLRPSRVHFRCIYVSSISLQTAATLLSYASWPSACVVCVLCYVSMNHCCTGGSGRCVSVRLYLLLFVLVFSDLFMNQLLCVVLFSLSVCPLHSASLSAAGCERCL